MSDTPTSQTVGDEFEFDVIVSIPLGIEKDILVKRAEESLGIPQEAIASLFKSLSEHRVVKVKSSVPRQQANEVAERFTNAGFRVEVNHTLTLKKIHHKTEDGTIECPACDKTVTLTAERQCPECKVFVDKLTPE